MTNLQQVVIDIRNNTDSKAVALVVLYDDKRPMETVLAVKEDAHYDIAKGLKKLAIQIEGRSVGKGARIDDGEEPVYHEVPHPLSEMEMFAWVTGAEDGKPLICMHENEGVKYPLVAYDLRAVKGWEEYTKGKPDKKAYLVKFSVAEIIDSRNTP